MISLLVLFVSLLVFRGLGSWECPCFSPGTTLPLGTVCDAPLYRQRPLYLSQRGSPQDGIEAKVESTYEGQERIDPLPHTPYPRVYQRHKEGP